MKPVITNTNANGEGGAVEWVKAGPSHARMVESPAQIHTMAKRVEERMLIVIAGRQGKDRTHSTELRTAYAGHLEQMRQALGAGSDPLETLLIERIVLTWVRLQWCEEQAAYTLMGDTSAKLAEEWDDRLNDAHSRFLRSCLALARVRKLQQRPRSNASAAAVAAVFRDSMVDGLRNARGLEIAGKMLAKRRTE